MLSSRRLLKEFVATVLAERRRGHKKLRVFDFDDTLVKTGSLIYVTSSSGENFTLTPGEYAVYEPQPDDEFDYSDFSKLIDPREIVWTVRILRNIIAKGGEVVILTARAAQSPVYQFLEDAGLPPIEVIALASGDPEKKADYIEKRVIDDGIDYVEFFDDSEKNVDAVRRRLMKYPSVDVDARHIVHREEV